MNVGQTPLVSVLEKLRVSPGVYAVRGPGSIVH